MRPLGTVFRRRALAVLAAAGLLAVAAACLWPGLPGRRPAPPPEITSATEIPGLSEEEAATLAKLKGQELAVGLPLSMDPGGPGCLCGKEKLRPCLERISEVFGFRLRIVEDSWENLQKDAASGALDLLAGVPPKANLRNDPADAAGLFRPAIPLLESHAVVYRRLDGPFIGTVQDLDGRAVGFGPERFLLQNFQRFFNLRTRNAVFKSNEEALAELLAGKVDAVVCNDASRQAAFAMPAVDCAFALPELRQDSTLGSSRRDLRPLFSALDKYLQAGDGDRLEEQATNAVLDGLRRQFRSGLDSREENLISNKRGKQIRVAVVETSFPFCFYRQGQACGIVPELFGLFRSETGINCAMDHYDNFETALSALTNGDAAVLFGVVRGNPIFHTDELTSSLRSTTMVFLARPACLQELNSWSFDGLRLGSTSSAKWILQSVSPALQPTSYENGALILQDLKNGRLDAALVPREEADYLLAQSESADSIVVCQPFPKNYEMAMAIVANPASDAFNRLLEKCMRLQRFLGSEHSRRWSGVLEELRQSASRRHEYRHLAIDFLVFAVFLAAGGIGLVFWRKRNFAGRNADLAGELAREQHLAAALLETNPNPMALLQCPPGGGGVLKTCNQAYSRLAGADRAMLQGQGLDDLPLVHDVVPWIGEAVKERSSAEQTFTEVGDGRKGTCTFRMIPASPAGAPAELWLLEMRPVDGREKEMGLVGMATRDAYLDPVSGLYNRNFFEAELKRLDRARLLPLVIIMGDMNNLKLVNDLFGHQAGDRMIAAVGTIIKTSFRDDDIVCRWGGDEFIAILPQGDKELALRICQRIRERCRLIRVEGMGTGIALGVAVKENKDEDVRRIIDQAEDQMYLDKELARKSGGCPRSAVELLMTVPLDVREHSIRVLQAGQSFGAYLGLGNDDLERLMALSILHDIGLPRASHDTTFRPDDIEDSVWDEIRLHPSTGAQRLAAVPELAQYSELVLMHHECLDGSGYPLGLQGEAIPRIVRILSLVDCYDIMIKSPGSAMSREQFVEFITQESGRRFDPELVRHFILHLQGRS